MQGTVRFTVTKIKAVIEPLTVCTVDVYTLVKQPVERFAIMAKSLRSISLRDGNKRSWLRLTGVYDDHLT
jgi:hypothetical protein